jgi:ribosomal protein RSM22 (predicted rRNA methylase)
MSPNEILKEILEDSIFQEKFNIDKEKLKQIELHKPSGYDIIEIIKTIILANSNNTSEINTYRQIKTFLNIS